VQDYYAVNPEFGTMKDFRSLVATAHRNGLKLIIDLVANHTAWDSRLMREHPEWFTKTPPGRSSLRTTTGRMSPTSNYAQPACGGT